MNEEIEQLEYNDEVEELSEVDEPNKVSYQNKNRNIPILSPHGEELLTSADDIEELTPTPSSVEIKEEHQKEENNPEIIPAASTPAKTRKLKNNGNYVSYERRIMTKVAMSLTMFVIACILLGKAVKTDEVKVTYNELSNVSYRVCLTKNQYYKEECVEPEMEYLSTITKNIPITFNYSANYSSIVKYNYSYYVTATLKIYNPDTEEKVLYKSSDKLTNKKKISNSSNTLAFSENVNVDFEKYNNYVNEYKSKYSLSTDSTLEVSLYLEDEDKVSKKVSGVTIPLSSQTFGITKNEISNANISATSVEKSWKNKNIIYAIASTISSILGIIIVIRLIIFILKTTTKKSRYELKLNQILKEYDRIIVRMKDKETFINDGKQEIKVYDFLELLDARDTLERPIIYIRVNNIKSEFYVEDMTRVYKYVMKESDFEEKESVTNKKN